MAVAPGSPGDLNGLTENCIRFELAKGMRIIVDQAGVDGFPAPDQYVALLGIGAVVVTREQVAGMVSPEKHPADLAQHALWVVFGDDTLLPKGTVRQELAVGSGIPPDVYAALLAGEDVEVTADQIAALVEPGKQPSADDLATYPRWLLSGYDTLTPAVA